MTQLVPRMISGNDVDLFDRARAEVRAGQSPSQFPAIKDAAARVFLLLDGEVAEAANRIASSKGWGVSDIVNVSEAVSALFYGDINATTAQSREPIRIRL